MHRLCISWLPKSSLFQQCVSSFLSIPVLTTLFYCWRSPQRGFLIFHFLVFRSPTRKERNWLLPVAHTGLRTLSNIKTGLLSFQNDMVLEAEQRLWSFWGGGREGGCLPDPFHSFKCQLEGMDSAWVSLWLLTHLPFFPSPSLFHTLLLWIVSRPHLEGSSPAWSALPQYPMVALELADIPQLNGKQEVWISNPRLAWENHLSSLNLSFVHKMNRLV